MITAAMADVSEGQFQAAWYFSIVAAAMFILMCVGGAWAVRGGIRVWRAGDRGAGAIITAAAVTTMLALLGLLLAAAVGLVRTGGVG